MRKFAILLPPAAQQNKHGNRFAPDVFDYRERTTFNYFHGLIPHRRALIDAVHRAIEVEGEDAMAEMVGGSDAVTLMKNVYSAQRMAARKRYEPNKLYSALDFPGLPTGAQRRFLENTVIVSGLFGILRPDDLIPEYALPIEAEVPGIGALTEYWRPRVSSLLNKALEGCFVWDLLDDLHRSVWENEETYKTRVRIRFLNRRTRTELTDTLKLRGALVHHLVQQNHINFSAISSWKGKGTSGFRFDEGRSDLDNPMDSIITMSRRR